MNPELEQRAEELFQQTLDLPAEQRTEFLQRCCEDSEILRRVETLLRHYEKAGQFLGTVDATAEPDQCETRTCTDRIAVGGSIGPYKVLKVIGQGGMGTVYQAEQDKPHRKVALKVLRPGVMTASMLRRFEFEADMLARLNHPGIARIYEAGMGDSGLGPQPYFAMELIEGVRLDQYLAAHRPRLRLRQLVELYHEICRAVQHAHAKGVVHRDLKPGNILIARGRKPKILDFGVARAIDSDVQSNTRHTEAGQLIGTLPYMSPEQAAGKTDELDTSSDVYALGVIGYELFSGMLPYAVEKKPLHEAVRIICERRPPRLSSIDKILRGDIEAIVHKALEKSKSRRFHTAGELAADVKRYLDYEPITARPPGTWYQLAKFAGRNKLLVCSVAALILVLAAGTIGTTIGLVQARQAQAEARRQAQLARDRADAAETVNRLMAGVIGRMAQQFPPDGITLLQAIQLGVEEADSGVIQTPHVEAVLRYHLGSFLYALGRHDEAERNVRLALDLRRKSLPPTHVDITLNAKTLASVLFAQAVHKLETGEQTEAEPLLREAIELLRATGQPTTEPMQAILTALIDVCDRSGRPDEAAHWRAELAALPAATQPNTQSP